MLLTNKEQLKNGVSSYLVQEITAAIPSIKNDAIKLQEQDLQKLQAQYE